MVGTRRFAHPTVQVLVRLARSRSRFSSVTCNAPRCLSDPIWNPQGKAARQIAKPAVGAR
jgi:hypothetical protein